MTPTELAIVSAIAADESNLVSNSPSSGRDPADIRLRLAKDDVETLGVRVDLQRWTGLTDPSKQRTARRTLLRLEADGLVRLSRSNGDHITHAASTVKGLRLLLTDLRRQLQERK